MTSSDSKQKSMCIVLRSEGKQPQRQIQILNVVYAEFSPWNNCIEFRIEEDDETQWINYCPQTQEFEYQTIHYEFCNVYNEPVL